MDKRVTRKTKRGKILVNQVFPELQFQEEPSLILALLNFGHTTGASTESLFSIFSKWGGIKALRILPQLSFCFVEMQDHAGAVAAFESLHGTEIEIDGTKHQLYLAYVKPGQGIPYSSDDERSPYPQGLCLLEDFVNLEEEADLIAQLDSMSSRHNGLNSELLKHRTVLHFGYDFDYSTNNVDKISEARPLPDFLRALISRMHERKLVKFNPDQVTVNIYEPGQGIPPHVDTHSAFEEDLVSLSLGSHVVMDFKDPKGGKAEVLLKRRSLLIMTGEARYVWKHGIVPRQVDVITNEADELTCVKRGRRLSVTFRQVRQESCACPFVQHCDRDEKKELDELVADKLETLHVHKVYDEIAGHFSATRHSPWPGVSKFLSEVNNGSVLLDVGCGNAKYFGLGRNIFEIGCDRSVSLLSIANNRGFQVFTADCRQIPFRSGVVDYIICIAVIHHLATTTRRLTALKEMARVLRPGGRCLVSVWSKDQGNSKYLQESRASDQPEVRGEFNLPVHKNRTQFVHGDVLVPWTLRTKGGKEESGCPVYHRYYHVFQESEFRQLCEAVPSIRICEIFQEQGNWIVIFEKS